MCCYTVTVEDIVVIEAVPSAFQGSERQHLLVVDCEDLDCLVSGLGAWCALVTWLSDEGGGAFPVDYSLANRLSVMCATLSSFQ